MAYKTQTGVRILFEKKLSVEVQSDPNAEYQLSLMVPMVFQKNQITGVEIDGQPAKLMGQTLGSVEYGRVLLDSGEHAIQVFYGAEA